jgi:5-oxoprolinase (ATP-hydrolysing)
MSARWRFAIDVGGTFTDCVARAPDGRLVTLKVLSSGRTLGRVESSEPNEIVDPARTEPEGFWIGYRLSVGEETVTVTAFLNSRLKFEPPFDIAPGTAYALAGGEEAPILAVRRVLGLRLDQPLPPLELRLGTTRGTNALLERRGARTALVTTQGFGDLLAIGDQTRPRLFDLAIRKPAPLAERTIEVDERVGADGTVLRPPDRDRVRRELEALAADGIESLAICFVHSIVHPEHEQACAETAREAGFAEISVGHQVAPVEKLLLRAQTSVLDAYLNPVLREYVARLRAALGGDSRFFVMTSAGGLVAAEHFSGKDSILSGPAAGVVGYAQAASAAGFDRSIGFDMGGTSTDVSRFGGSYEMQFEADKAGVRVVAPMLAIETVAAGGGSICAFDGVKLTVGPHSAGADPGPACYGRGGPLTVTDCNLVLGRLVADRFPFPLDEAAARARLESLAAEIARVRLGPCAKRRAGRDEPPLDAAALAEGFVQVANAAMVRAIRTISVARGFDPRDHVLAAFGAAGGQHACALARELRIRRVLLHPHAGVLSAWGVGFADVRRFREQTVLAPLDSNARSNFERLFKELAAQARADVEADGIPAERIAGPRCSLDLRYRGLDSALTIERPDDDDWADAYARAHERLFGYRQRNRPIEIVSARVEVIGRGDATQTKEPAARASTAEARTIETWFGGRAHETRVVLREALSRGTALDGPAIILEPTSTTVVEPGFFARVLDGGEILLEDRAAAVDEAKESAAADPIRLEIFNQRFAAIAEQMGEVLRRTASSTNVKERLDFSCALFTAEGDLVVNAPHIPVHLGAMGETVRSVLADHPGMRAGDVFVTNDPHRGGSHLPDITVVTPVFASAVGLRDDRRLFFVASRAHHADVGGVVPGSMPPASRTLDEEGVVLRGFKLSGASGMDELRALLTTGPHPARRPDDNIADVAAQIAANQAGIAGLRELLEHHPQSVVQAYMRHIQDAASAKTRQALARFRPGPRHFVDHLDDGTPIAVTIDLAPDRAVVDFAGTGAAHPGNLNANRAIATAAVLYAFRCLLAEDIPLNAGVLAPIDIRIPPGSLLDPPATAAVVGGNVETSQRIVDVLLGALGVAAASQGTMNNLSCGDASFGYYETLCGGAGATADADGADAVHTHMTNTRLTDPEILERRCPVRLLRFAIRRHSGGVGTHRGGDGVVRALEFLRPLDVSILSERRGPHAPFGLEGGQAGTLGRNVLVHEGAERLLPAKVQLRVEAGDVLILETPGGGGFGKP